MKHFAFTQVYLILTFFILFVTKMIKNPKDAGKIASFWLDLLVDATRSTKKSNIDKLIEFNFNGNGFSAKQHLIMGFIGTLILLLLCAWAVEKF